METVEFASPKQIKKRERQEKLLARFRELQKLPDFYVWGACRVLAKEFGYSRESSVYIYLKRKTII